MLSFLSKDDIKMEKNKNNVFVKSNLDLYKISIVSKCDCLFSCCIVIKSKISTSIQHNNRIIIKEKDNEQCLFSISLKTNDIINIETNGIITFTNISILINNINDNIVFKNIFIINLDKDYDRRESMVSKLINIKKYEFIQGEYCKNGLTGHEGCYYSHLKCLKIAKNRNYEYVIIMEDDTYFNDDFLEIIEKINIPNDYKMIYFGGITTSVKMFMNDICSIKNFYVMGAYAYLVKNTFYDELIQIIESNNGKPIDHIYIEYVQRKKNGIYLLNDCIKTVVENSNTSSKTKTFYDNFNKINKKYNIITI